MITAHASAPWLPLLPYFCEEYRIAKLNKEFKLFFIVLKKKTSIKTKFTLPKRKIELVEWFLVFNNYVWTHFHFFTHIQKQLIVLMPQSYVNYSYVNYSSLLCPFVARKVILENVCLGFLKNRQTNFKSSWVLFS